MNMNINVKNLLFFMPSLMIASCSVSGGGVDEGPGKYMNCVQSSGDLCRIPFSEAISSRDELIGVTVSLKGFFVNDNNGYAIFDSMEKYKYGIQEGAIRVVVADSDLAEAERVNMSYVVVVGVLERDEEYWASIRTVQAPQELPEVLAEYPPAPPNR